MKGDVKREIDKGIETVQKKVKSGVDYIKGEAPDDQSESPPGSSPRPKTLKRNVPNKEASEPNPQSKWVPKYCPYCGGPLTGLFSCADNDTSLLSDDDEEKENVEEDADVLNERPSRDASRRMPIPRNVPTSKTNDKEDIEEVQQGAEDENENYQEGSKVPAGSPQSMQGDPSLRQTVKQNPQVQQGSKPVQKYCPYCASPLTGSIYCPNCGNKVK